MLLLLLLFIFFFSLRVFFLCRDSKCWWKNLFFLKVQFSIIRVYVESFQVISIYYSSLSRMDVFPPIIFERRFFVLCSWIQGFSSFFIFLLFCRSCFLLKNKNPSPLNVKRILFFFSSALRNYFFCLLVMCFY